jgi:hypothetical protein
MSLQFPRFSHKPQSSWCHCSSETSQARPDLVPKPHSNPNFHAMESSAFTATVQPILRNVICSYWTRHGLGHVEAGKRDSLECLTCSCYTGHSVAADIWMMYTGWIMGNHSSYSDIKKYLFIIQYTQFLRVVQMIVVLVYTDSTAVLAVSSYRLLPECLQYWVPHPAPFLEATILLRKLTFSRLRMSFMSHPCERKVDTAGRVYS